MITRHPINKSISDQLGVTKYQAIFVTDNNTFVKCQLNVTGGIPLSYYDDVCELNFTSMVRSDPEDQFNMFTGNYKAIKRCIDKLETSIVHKNFGQISSAQVTTFLAKTMGGKSRWDSLFQHLAQVDMLYLAQLNKIMKGKDRQLKLLFN